MTLDFAYADIERQLVEALPQLEFPAKNYWLTEGEPGDDSGPYIFFPLVVETYMDLLLELPESSRRDALLSNTWEVFEQMLTSDDRDVRDLATIQLFEGSYWRISRARNFLGLASKQAISKLEKNFPGLLAALENTNYSAGTEFPKFDSQGASFAVLKALDDPELTIENLSSITAPHRWQRLDSVEAARSSAYGVAMLASFGTSLPLVVAPASMVRCEETALQNLLHDLLTIKSESPDELAKARLTFFRIHPGERIYNMHGPEAEGLKGTDLDHSKAAHLRWRNELWMKSRYRELESDIARVLAGELDHIQPAPSPD